MSTAGLMFRCTERYVFGYFNPACFNGSNPGKPDYTFEVGRILFQTDAIARGYDMALWKEPWRSYGGRL